MYIPIESSNCNRPSPSRAYDKPSFSTAQLIQVLTPLTESAAIKAFNAAQQLREEVCNLYGIPFIAAPSVYIIDSGAGVNLTDTSKANEILPAEHITLHTANGTLLSKTMTKDVIHKLFGDMEFRVLENSPSVLSLGRLIRINKMKFTWDDEKGPVLINKDGNVIPLSVFNDVSFLSEDLSNLHALPACDVSPTPNSNRTDQQCMDDYELSKIEMQEHQLVSNSHDGYVHECLHMFGGKEHPNCNICKVAKQRRRKASTIKADDKVYAIVFGEKTSFDTFEAGRNALSNGIGNKKYALAVVDEATGWATFCPSNSKDYASTADGLLEHFGSNLNKAKMFYCDGYPAFKRVAKLLRIPTKYSTPNTPTSNSRQESWMRILGDGIRTLLYSAGLTSAWWPLAGAYFCNAWNILRINPRSGKTAFQQRFPKRVPPTLMPFGSGCTFCSS